MRVRFGLSATDHPTPLTSEIRGEARALAFIALWFVAVALAAGIWWDVPLIDDWTYAWSVEHLLTTGRFEVLDWTGNFVLGQILWGTAWSALLGFSFVALRLSTLVLGFVACAGLYLLLRDLDAPRKVALVGALTLAVNPVFVVFSASFMTDVPFTACTTLSLLCFVRAARFDRSRYLWWACIWAFAASTVRQVGVVVPIAGVPLLWSRGPRAIGRPKVAAALTVTWLAIAAQFVSLEAFVGRTTSMGRWVDQLGYFFLVPPRSYFHYNLDLLVVLAFFLLPALLFVVGATDMWRSRALAAAGILSVAILLAVFGELPMALGAGETWNLRELGSSRALVSGSYVPQSPWVRMPIRIAGLLAFAIAVAVLLRRSRAALRHLATDSAGSDRPHFPAGITPQIQCLLAFAAGYLAIINVFWLYNDRYYLALIPPLVALILCGIPAARAPRLAWVAIVVFALTALAGSRDAFRFNLAIRNAWESLVDSGITPSEIDAGYTWNGWALYAHPEHLPEALRAERDVPWINSSRETEYVLAKSPIEGYTIERVVSWTALPWPGPDRLFVLRRRRQE